MKIFQKHPQGNNAQKEGHSCAEFSEGCYSTLYEAYPPFSSTSPSEDEYAFK